MTPSPPPTPAPGSRPSLLQNWVSLLGLILAASAFFAAILLIAQDLIRGGTSPYLGILTYIVTPAFLIAGLLIVILGALLERRRRRRAVPEALPRFPRIDLNVTRQRRLFVATVVVAFVFLVTTGLGTYQTYHFTESVSFCGQTCHQVMHPEFTAYQNSPHARVTCVQCHIGPGAGWFVKSKLSGAYQVYATLADKYPRPIPTPIRNLRPAQETCEQCHWPQKFYGNGERVNYHYLSDSANTRWTIRLLLKIGGGDPTHGPVGGIHWHMNIDNTVEYIHTDSARQMIPWVRITGPDGRATVYRSDGDSLTDAQVDSAPKRRMDCIDCHNRPSHIYNSPSHAVNVALSTGRISTALPSIKSAAVAALSADYDSTAQATAAIAAGLMAQYRSYPDTGVVAQAVREVQRIYRANFFPEMRASWRVYPDNIGHSVFPGCYRCHDGKHKREDGTPITHACDACHIIIGQGPAAEAETIRPDGLQFRHPVDVGEMWRTVNCSACHGPP